MRPDTIAKATEMQQQHHAQDEEQDQEREEGHAAASLQSATSMRPDTHGDTETATVGQVPIAKASEVQQQHHAQDEEQDQEREEGHAAASLQSATSMRPDTHGDTEIATVGQIPIMEAT